MKSLTILIFTCSFSAAFGQTMFWNHYSLYNPAAAGVLYQHEGNLTARSQLNNPDYKYAGYFANYNARVKKLHGGLGINYTHYQYGDVHNTSDLVKLNYSYHIRLGEEAILAIGASASYLSMHRQFNYFNGLEDVTENRRDGAISTHLGVHFQRRNFNAGFSVLNLTHSYLDGSGTPNFTADRGYVLYADYLWNITENFALKPAVLIGFYPGQSATTQLSLRAIMQKKYWFGVSASNRTLGLTAGIDFKERFSLGYSYEVYSNPGMNSFANGIHEVTLGIKLK